MNTLIEFAKRAGVDPKLVNFRNSADVWDEWRRLSMKGPYNFGGMTRERMKRESGLIWPCPTETHPGTNLRYVRGEDPNIPADHPEQDSGSTATRAARRTSGCAPTRAPPRSRIRNIRST